MPRLHPNPGQCCEQAAGAAPIAAATPVLLVPAYPVDVLPSEHLRPIARRVVGGGAFF